jgi:hypothetical protein
MIKNNFAELIGGKIGNFDSSLFRKNDHYIGFQTKRFFHRRMVKFAITLFIRCPTYIAKLIISPTEVVTNMYIDSSTKQC